MELRPLTNIEVAFLEGFASGGLWFFSCSLINKMFKTRWIAGIVAIAAISAVLIPITVFVR